MKAELTHIKLFFKPSQLALLVLWLCCFESGCQLVRSQEPSACEGVLQEGIVNEDVLLLGWGNRMVGGAQWKGWGISMGGHIRQIQSEHYAPSLTAQWHTRTHTVRLQRGPSLECISYRAPAYVTHTAKSAPTSYPSGAQYGEVRCTTEYSIHTHSNSA